MTTMEIVSRSNLRPFLEDDRVTELVVHCNKYTGSFLSSHIFFELVTSFYLLGFMNGKRTERKKRHNHSGEAIT